VETLERFARGGDLIDRAQAIANVKLAVKMAGIYFAFKSYTADTYRSAIEDVARRFYSGGSRDSFNMGLRNVIRMGLRDAFLLGAKDIGILEEDLIQADWDDLQAIIEREQGFVASLADFIRQGQAAGTPFPDLGYRIDMWGNTFDDVRSQAKTILGKNEKLEWVLGDAEHCDSCARLSGIVKRASFWKDHGVQPRNPKNEKLICEGYNCQCTLQPTDKPITRGRLPSLP
jgi:hypothetical protein